MKSLLVALAGIAGTFAIVSVCRSSHSKQSFARLKKNFQQKLLSVRSRLGSGSGEKSANFPRLVLLGSGSSTGCPRPFCLTPAALEQRVCKTCTKAWMDEEPIYNRNYRTNPSLLIQPDPNSNIVIDVGKTFRESSIRWFPVYGVNAISAIILTHGHADAIFGLDDVRGVQDFRNPGQIPVYLDKQTFDVVKRSFPYLIPKIDVEERVQRSVAMLNYNTIGEFKSFSICGITFLPVPLIHGEDLVSLGFLFGRVAYLSDVSRIPDITYEELLKKDYLELLIIDSLFFERKHPTHFSLKEALSVIEVIRPKRTVIVGMSDDMEYEEVNHFLMNWTLEKGIHVELGFDGMHINLKEV